MSLVAIIGAGEIGGAAARALASRSRVDIVRLIDEKESVAAGKALDLMQAGPICRIGYARRRPQRIWRRHPARRPSCWPTRSARREWAGEPGLGASPSAQSGLSRTSVLICAGAGQRALMQQGLDELGLPRRRVIGSAPEALAATARALVAIEARAASNQVTLDGARHAAGPDGDSVERGIGGRAQPSHSMLTASQLHQLKGGCTVCGLQGRARLVRRRRCSARRLPRTRADCSAHSCRWTATTAPKHLCARGPYPLVQAGWNGSRSRRSQDAIKVIVDEVLQ